MAEENQERRFTILGETGSGKTCYLLGMYYAMSMYTANYMVVATTPYVDRVLLRLCQMLKDKSRGRSRFTAASTTKGKSLLFPIVAAAAVILIILFLIMS